MSALTIALGHLHEFVVHETDLRRALASVQDRINEQRDEIAKIIMSGETTGKNARDFALVHGHDQDSTFAEWHMMFRLGVNVEALRGSLALIITNEAHPNRTLRETLQLGILSGEFDYPTNGDASFALPMQRHVRYQATGKVGEMRALDEPVRIGGDGREYWNELYVPLGQTIDASLPDEYEPAKFDIVFGEEAVRWAIRRGPEHPLILRRMAKLLGYDPDDVPLMSDYLAERRTRLIDQLAEADAARDAALKAFDESPASGRKPRKPNYRTVGDRLIEATSLVRAYLRLATELDLDDHPEVIRVTAKLPPA